MGSVMHVAEIVMAHVSTQRTFLIDQARTKSVEELRHVVNIHLPGEPAGLINEGGKL